ncbi:MAG: hypothetical protein JW715_09805 [Sedimentisphaerales bacterium]|nr:hypothetical protein [Sedimentisphaerales bacterium]
MSILTANLKQLYQRRGCWFAYAFFVFFNLPYLFMEFEELKKEWAFVFLLSLMWFYLIGILVMSMQREILSKPFIFCLPNHRTVIWKFIMIVGVAVSLLFSIFFINFYSELDLWQLLPVVFSGFSILLTFYLLGVCFALPRGKCETWGIFVPLILLLGMFYGIHDIFVICIEWIPAFFIISSILIIVLAWRLLKDDSIARRFYSKTVIGFFDACDGVKIQRKRQAIMAEKGEREYETNPKVERYFLKHMQKCDSFGMGRYIWGSLYARWGKPKNGFSILILVFFLVLVFLGYSKVSFILFLFGSTTVYTNIPLYSNMLIFGGRKERFATTIIMVITNMVLVTAICTILAAFSILIESIMPDVTLYGKIFSFQAVDIRLFFIPLFLIPIASIFNLVFYYRYSFLVGTFNMLLFMTMSFIIILITKQHIGLSIDKMVIYIPRPEVIVILLFLSWSLFLAILKYICDRRPLVR